MTDDVIAGLVAELAGLLEAGGSMVVAAESCTGGWIAKSMTDRAGSSGWFDRGFVTYSNEAKSDMLGVAGTTLAEAGAVSEPVALEMARGALARSRAGFAVAVTGVAGPSGGTPQKPVGTVWFAWAGAGGRSTTHLEWFAGDREAVRRGSVELALEGLRDFVAGAPGPA